MDGSYRELPMAELILAHTTNMLTKTRSESQAGGKGKVLLEVMQAIQ